ncbi:hypothetical protein V8D89_002008 [Ganoderma adspersum]
MPPRVKNRKDDAQASAAIQPNAEVTRLQKELQLCNLRLSQMQARLMATLDDLDASRNAHQVELKAERRAKERLSEKLDRYLSEVRRADAERDEMREVVSILVEKVEACNDYSAWPYARMSLARPLALYGALGQGSRHVEPPLDDDNDAVRTVLLESVHKRLEGERQAHARTKQEADAETLRLRAMVARRDAELEACATHSGHRVLLSSSLSTNVPSSSNGHQHFPRSNEREHHGDEFIAGPSRVSRSHEGVAPVVSIAGTRERTLEREVAFLQGQLQQARIHRSRALNHDTHPTPIPRTSSSQPATQFEIALDARLSESPNVPEGPPRGRTAPPSPQLRPQDMSSTPSDYVLTPANARTPSRQDGTRNSSRSRIRSEVLEESGTPVASGSLDDLRHQVGLLSSEIDAFSAERGAVKKMLAEARIQGKLMTPQQSAAQPPANIVLTERAPVPSPSHDSCIRETQALREEFDQLGRQTARREREMQAEIDSLRQALFNARAQQREPADDDETRCAPGDPKEPVAPPPLPPSTRALHSPRIPSALRLPSPVQHPGAVLDVLEAQIVDNTGGDDDNDEGRGQGAEALQPGTEAEVDAEPDEEIGSEMDEQSMELATPLHPTILSLADDDLIIPPPMPPSLAASTSTTTTATATAREELEPSDIPLPISPDDGLAFSPLFASSPTHMHPPPHLRSQSCSSPPLLFSANIPHAPSSAPVIDTDPARISSSDLLARVESATHARVAEIEREVDEVQRDLDARTRELAAKNAALAHLRATATATATAPWLHGDAGTGTDTSGGMRAREKADEDEDEKGNAAAMEPARERETNANTNMKAKSARAANINTT